MNIKITAIYIIILIQSVLLSSCFDRFEKKIRCELIEDKDIISMANSEIITNYESLINNFSEKSVTSDGLEDIIYCSLDSMNLKQLNSEDYNSTHRLLEKGYIIEIDAKNYYRVFYELARKEYFMGIVRYGFMFHDKTKEMKNTHSLTFGKIDTIQQINANLFIIQDGQHAE